MNRNRALTSTVAFMIEAPHVEPSCAHQRNDYLERSTIFFWSRNLPAWMRMRGQRDETRE